MEVRESIDEAEDADELARIVDDNAGKSVAERANTQMSQDSQNRRNGGGPRESSGSRRMDECKGCCRAAQVSRGNRSGGRTETGGNYGLTVVLNLPPAG